MRNVCVEWSGMKYLILSTILFVGSFAILNKKNKHYYNPDKIESVLNTQNGVDTNDAGVSHWAGQCVALVTAQIGLKEKALAVCCPLSE